MSNGPRFTSSWLSGTVRHRRHAPVGHEFCYNTGMLALNLDEWTRFADASPLVSVDRFNGVSIHRRDYLDPSVPDLRQAVADRVERSTGWRPDGPIELISHPRHFGYVFNPVSFYFCYRPGDRPWEGAVPRVILAQITNTPWQERHVYCLEVGDINTANSGWKSVKAGFSKRFHVSPFNPMNQTYQWTFSFRGPDLRIHMNVYQSDTLQSDTLESNTFQSGTTQKAPPRVFDATLVVHRTRITRKTLHRSLLRFPVESFKVVAGIYWHALRLKLKGVPFHTHPDKLPDDHPQRGLGREDRGLDNALPDTTTPQSAAQTPTRIRSWRT